MWNSFFVSQYLHNVQLASSIIRAWWCSLSGSSKHINVALTKEILFSSQRFVSSFCTMIPVYWWWLTSVSGSCYSGGRKHDRWSSTERLYTICAGWLVCIPFGAIFANLFIFPRSFRFRIFRFRLSSQGMFIFFLWAIVIIASYNCSFFDQNFRHFWRKVKRTISLN